MWKKVLLASLLAVGSTAAMADNDIGCGFGTQIWAGQKGPIQKLLAATTNGISTNGWLGITFGTLGCGGFNKTITAQVVSFVDHNAETLARDMAVGDGESLNTLAELMNIQDQDKAHFFAVSKTNLTKLYSEQNGNTLQVITALQSMMAQDETLRKYG